MNAPEQRWAPAGRGELIARNVLLVLLGLVVGAIAGAAGPCAIDPRRCRLVVDARGGGLRPGACFRDCIKARLLTSGCIATRTQSRAA